ncbi:MAG: hypothetical protein ACXVB9_06650 [Bdellovibrionota bacterium]
MKPLVAILLLALAPIAQAAPAVVLESSQSAGFTPDPKSHKFTLTDDGKMSVEIFSFKDHTKKLVDLGSLSSEGMKLIEDQVSFLDAKAPLIDLNKGSPDCSDAPVVETAAYVKGVRKVIARSASCHSYQLEYGQGASLAGFASTFVY